MSAETMEWLNRFTLQSKAVWHTDAQLQKIYNTVYDGFIPVEDVLSRLFHWEALEAEMIARTTILSESGVETIEMVDATRKIMMRPPGALGPDDPGGVLGVFKSGYQGHNYAEWLVRNVGTILSDKLGVMAAGLLRDGAQAFVQVSIPDTITTTEGVTFKPNLLAVTSYDGSLATTYKRTITNTVCDNTMGMALREDGQQYKLKHTRNSGLKIMEARDALEMVYATADDFAAEVTALTSIEVSDGDWSKFLDEIAPQVDEKGEVKTGRALTMADKKREELSQLWNYDARVSPWKGTAYGVVQAMNTHAHHLQTVRGSERDERNMALNVAGAFDKLDAGTLETLTAAMA